MIRDALTIWLTGLPSSGKSTIAEQLRIRMESAGVETEVLDGDEIRKVFSPDLGFTKADRDLNVHRIGHIAKLLNRHRITVIVAAVSPYREARDRCRREIGAFVEVYCECPLECAVRRDAKGLYERARRGEIRFMTGVDDAYEPPTQAEIAVATHRQTVAESVETIWTALHELGYFVGG